MPTSTESSGATETDLTMPRSVIGRWISGSETVASAAWIASSSGEAITPPGYVGRLSGEAGAAGDQRLDMLPEPVGVDRDLEEVVGAGVARLALEAVADVLAQHQHREDGGARLAAEQPHELHTGQIRELLVDHDGVVRTGDGLVQSVTSRLD